MKISNLNAKFSCEEVCGNTVNSLWHFWFLFILICCNTCPRPSSGAAFAYLYIAWSTALHLWVLSLLLWTKCQKKEPLTLQGVKGHKLTVTVTNKHSLTLLVLFSNLYQMVKSPCTEMWFLEPTGFGVQSKYPKSVFTRLDVGGFFHWTAAVPCLWFEAATIDSCRQSLYKN